MHPIRVHVEGNNPNLIISGAKNTCAGLSVAGNTSCNILVRQVWFSSGGSWTQIYVYIDQNLGP
jgi:hypothetical protein